jgi:hypothetical protein
MDGCSDRGRRAVRRNGGLNRRKRCDDMWVFPQMSVAQRLIPVGSSIVWKWKTIPFFSILRKNSENFNHLQLIKDRLIRFK